MLSSLLSKTNQKRLTRRLTPTIQRCYSWRNSIYSAIEDKAVPAYWYQENNFGDQLTPDILRYYGACPIFSPTFEKCQVVSVGSILELVPASYNGIILGAGFIYAETEKQFPLANVALVRGQLTADKLALSESMPLGDPGILVDEIYARQIDGVHKQHTIGLIPHYKHIEHLSVRALMNRYSEEIHLIDVRQKPAEVVCEIAACQHVLSSSLHGIISAHSLGVSVAPIEMPGSELRGGSFKFKDYFSLYEMAPQFYTLSGQESLDDLCCITRVMDPDLVNRVKENVRQAFTQSI